MSALFWFGVIIAGCGVALVLGQLVLTLFFNYQLLQDSFYQRPFRYSYQHDYMRELVDLSLFLRFINDTKDEALWHILRRKRFRVEVWLRRLGNICEVIGGFLICCDVFNLNLHSRFVDVVFAMCMMCVVAYCLNFVFVFIWAKISQLFYKRFWQID